MFLKLKHTELDVYNLTKRFVVSCYAASQVLPTEEKFGLTNQIRRAALSAHLNLAEGCSRKSAAERKRFFEVSRGSIIEVDTAFDIAIHLGYLDQNALKDLGTVLVRCFQLISKMIN